MQTVSLFSNEKEIKKAAKELKNYESENTSFNYLTTDQVLKLIPLVFDIQILMYSDLASLNERVFAPDCTHLLEEGIETITIYESIENDSFGSITVNTLKGTLPKNLENQEKFFKNFLKRDSKSVDLFFENQLQDLIDYKEKSISLIENRSDLPKNLRKALVSNLQLEVDQFLEEHNALKDLNTLLWFNSLVGPGKRLTTDEKGSLRITNITGINVLSDLSELKNSINNCLSLLFINLETQEQHPVDPLFKDSVIEMLSNLSNTYKNTWFNKEENSLFSIFLDNWIERLEE